MQLQLESFQTLAALEGSWHVGLGRESGRNPNLCQVSVPHYCLNKQKAWLSTQLLNDSTTKPCLKGYAINNTSNV